jgi:acetyl esterase/lipase
MKSDRRARRIALLAIAVGLLLVSWRTWGRSLRHFEPLKPRPDLVNIRYGPHERNVVDLWIGRPKPGALPARTPLVVFFHGGGFRSGDKSSVPAWLIDRCLDEGISVASANYRLSQTAPYPAPMRDGARTIQFLRFRAAELNIDAGRIAAAGSSAGAGIALWVGFHDDLADPKSADPVARQSSRVLCLGVDGAQTSYDPRFIKDLIGGRASEHPALSAFYGITEGAPVDAPGALELFAQASPVNHVSAGDPPAILFYSEPDAPLPADARPGQGIHHPRFGRALKQKLEPLGIECILRHRGDFPAGDDYSEDMCREMTAFFVRHFRGALGPSGKRGGEPVNRFVARPAAAIGWNHSLTGRGGR